MKKESDRIRSNAGKGFIKVYERKDESLGDKERIFI